MGGQYTSLQVGGLPIYKAKLCQLESESSDSMALRSVKLGWNLDKFKAIAA